MLCKLWSISVASSQHRCCQLYMHMVEDSRLRYRVNFVKSHRTEDILCFLWPYMWL